MKGQIFYEPLSGFADVDIVFQIHIFVLDRPPQPPGEAVVYCTPHTIHADLYNSRYQLVHVLWTGEIAALVAVLYVWFDAKHDPQRTAQKAFLGPGPALN